jgi:PEP-CTERM motif
MRTTCLMTTALLTFGCIAASGARAAYTITFTESGGNVMESGSGSFDLTGLNRIGDGMTDGSLNPRGGMFSGGLEGQQLFLYAVPITDPVLWGPGDFSFASSTLGDAVKINVRGPYIGVSRTYESGQPLSESSVFANSTFESLGLTAGTYVENWGSGATADSFTVVVEGAASPVPEPASWAMMLVGFAGLGFAGFHASRRGAPLNARPKI